jgi:CubicO group peptidase (beta-lactamase class C family)
LIVMKRALALLLVTACVSTQQPRTNGPWTQWATPADAGFDAQALEAVREQADKAQSGAVMVVYRGRVLAAWGDVSRKLELHSVRKSLYAALYGIAAEKGLVDVNETLAELGVDDLSALTADEKKARLEDLLYARSGVYHPSAYSPSDQDEERPKRGAHAPGTHWFYNNWDFNVAGALLERAANKPLGQLFDEWIARPTGMEDFASSDVVATYEPRTSRWPALTFRMSARDLARFGQMWMDEELVPAEWIARASQPRSQLQAPGEGYGMMWWTFAKGSLSAERYPNLTRYAMLQARGTGGQALTLIPELDLVFVHRGDTDHGRQVRGRDVWLMLEAIVAARRGEPPANARFTALQPVPLASQLPPLEWPEFITLDTATRDAVLGRYQFAPNVVAEVFLHEGKLYVFMPGEGEAELFAKSPTEFMVRVDPGAKIRIEGGKVFVTMQGRELIGVRQP